MIWWRRYFEAHIVTPPPPPPPTGNWLTQPRSNQDSDLSEALDILSSCDADHVAIIWDEFGRHIEGLIAEGQAHALQAVQTIAEWTARATQPSASLVLLMHQSLLAYAGSLNQTTRGEWSKVAGRFRHLQFLEDSRELYDLIADVVQEKRPAGFPATPGKKLRQIADRAVHVRWFDNERDARRIQRILRRADPVTAAALQTLPRVVARIGQNERSLFSFVEDAQLDRTVGTVEVYRAFADTMRGDVGIGGTHRRWVETENALSPGGWSIRPRGTHRRLPVPTGHGWRAQAPKPQGARAGTLRPARMWIRTGRPIQSSH